MNALICSVTLIMLATMPIKAQLTIGGTFRGGYVSLAHLNDLSLSVYPNHKPPLQAPLGTVGCEFFISNDRTILTLTILGMGRHGNSDRASSIDLTASTRFLKIGWVFARNNSFVIYPSIGPGITTVSLKPTNTQTNEIKHFYQYATDVGISADWQIRERSVRNHSNQHMILVGIRIGGLISWQPIYWPNSLNNGTTFMMEGRWSGYYATLTVGAGSFFNKRLSL